MIAIVDCFDWIEFLVGTEKEVQVREILAGADVSATPDVVLAEVTRKLSRDGIGRTVVRRRVADISTLSQVIPISPEIALGVHKAEVELRADAKYKGLSNSGLLDAVILSTARILRGTVLTGDPHFPDLRETTWLGS